MHDGKTLEQTKSGVEDVAVTPNTCDVLDSCVSLMPPSNISPIADKEYIIQVKEYMVSDTERLRESELRVGDITNMGLTRDEAENALLRTNYNGIAEAAEAAE